MTTILLIVIFLLVWFGISVYWFLQHLGEKWRKDQWYDIFFAAPLLGVLWVANKFRK